MYYGDNHRIFWRKKKENVKNGNVTDKSETAESSNSDSKDKVPPLMAACHQGLEHSVSKILWRKVRIQ